MSTDEGGRTTISLTNDTPIRLRDKDGSNLKEGDNDLFVDNKLTYLRNLVETDGKGRSIANKGFGMREPIQNDVVDLANRGDEQAKKYIQNITQTDFARVQPTKVTIDDDIKRVSMPDKEQVETPIEKTVKTSSPFGDIDDIVNSDKSSEEKITALDEKRNNSNAAYVDKKIDELTFNTAPGKTEKEVPNVDIHDNESVGEVKTPIEDSAYFNQVYQSIKKFIPDFTTDELRIIKQIGTLDGDALAKFKDGIIMLQHGEDLSFDDQKVKEEAFHKIFHQFLDKPTQDKLLSIFDKEMRSDYGMDDNEKSTAKEIEEYVAARFRSWKDIPEPLLADKHIGFINKVFNKIREIVNSLFRMFSTDKLFYEDVFAKINRGDYKERLVSNEQLASLNDGEGVERNLPRIDTYFPEKDLLTSMQVYSSAINVVKGIAAKYHGLKQSKITGETVYDGNGKPIYYEGAMLSLDEIRDRMVTDVNTELFKSLGKDRGAYREFLKDGGNRKEFSTEYLKDDRTKALFHLSYKEINDGIIDNPVLKSLFEEVLGQRMTDRDVKELQEEIVSNESANINDETFLNTRVNHAREIMSKVKDVLSFIERDKNGHYMSASRAYYIAISDVFKDFKVTGGNLTDKINILDKRGQDFARGSDQVKVIDRIVDLMKLSRDEYPKITALEYKEGNFYVDNKKIVREGRNQFDYYNKVIDALKDKVDITDHTELLNLLDSKRRSSFALNKTVQTLYEFKNLVQEHPMTVLSDTKSEDRQNEIPGSRTLKLVSQNKRSIIDSYKGNIVNAIINSLSTKEGDSVSYDKIVTLFTNTPVKDQNAKVNTLTDVFRMLNLNFNKDFYTSTELTSLYNDTKDLFTKGKTVKDYETKNATVREKDIKKVVNTNAVFSSNQNTRLSNISSLLLKYVDYTNSNSYIGKDGNSRYLNITRSWLYDVHDALKGVSDEKLPKNYITDNNPYVIHPENIGDVIRIDMSKSSKDDVSYDVRESVDFSNKDWYETQVLASMVNMLSRGSDNYIQFTQVEAGRPTMHGIEIKFPTVQELEDNINKARDYEQARKDNRKVKEKQVEYHYRESDNKFLGKTNDEVLSHIFDNAMNSFDFFNRDFFNQDYDREMFDNATIKLNEKFSKMGRDNTPLSYSVFEKRLKQYNDGVDEKITDSDRAYMHYVNNVFNYVNGYHIDNLLFGDAFGVKNETTLIKRMSDVGSPAKMLVTGSEFAPETNHYVVCRDPQSVMKKTQDIAGLYAKVYGDPIDVTDGATLCTPEFVDNHIVKGTGDNTFKGAIKNHANYVDINGNSVAHKTATFILTDAICEMSPDHDKLRTQMRDAGVDQYIFLSSMKRGAPADKDILSYGQKIEKRHIKEMPNKYYGIQSNPQGEYTHVKNPSQNEFHLNTNDKASIETDGVYNAHATIVDLQDKLHQIVNKIYIKENGNTIASRRNLIDHLKDMDGMDDNIKDMLYNGIDISYPAIVNTIVPKIASMMYRNVNKIDFPGGKYPLMPDLGIHVYDIDGMPHTYSQINDKRDQFTPITGKKYLDIQHKIDKFGEIENSDLPGEVLVQVKDAIIRTNSILQQQGGSKFVVDNSTHFSWVENLSKLSDNYSKDIASKANNLYTDYISKIKSGDVHAPRKLLFRDKDGFSECIVPSSMAKAMGLSEGDMMKLDVGQNKKRMQAMGTRIPSTGIHSVILFKIIGISENAERIIAPEELIRMHGSDFDIDSLFVMRRETYNKDMVFDKSYSKGLIVGYDHAGNFSKIIADKIMSLPDTEDNIKLKIQLQKNIMFDNMVSIYSK
jgi:hypothetical protein